METIIIDVRTKKEFNEGSYPGAINIASDEFDKHFFLKYHDNHIALVCSSGNRAKKVLKRLKLEGFENVSLMQNQMVHLTRETNQKNTIWTIDRQFRLALGLLIGIFLIGNYIFSLPLFLGLLLIVFFGLIYSAVTDNCYLKIFISKLPWNIINK